jgi:hypothetical protein
LAQRAELIAENSREARPHLLYHDDRTREAGLELGQELSESLRASRIRSDYHYSFGRLQMFANG